MKVKKLLSVVTAFGICATMAAISPVINSKADSLTGTNWNLVWSDEFNGSSLDTTKWTYDTGAGGWGNNELECYTNRTQNVNVTGGNLVITAQPESYGGANYTSGRIKTQGLFNFTYGRIEARIKLPDGQGLWPAFWMLGSNITSVGWPQCGELDAMEHIDNSSNIAGSTHWYSNGQADYSNVSGSLDFSQFHTYDVVWDSNNITWYVDGVQFNQFYIGGGAGNTQAFQQPFFILMNLAVGGNWPGNPDGSTQWPAQMLVDYVRVYQNAGSGTQTVATPTFSVGAGTYSSAQSVALSCGTSGATIHYTTDGSTPNASSAVYSSPINVSSSETINAYAVESGMTDSSVASAAYIINTSSGGGSYNIGHFTAQLSMSGANLNVTLIPNTQNDTSSNIWYTNISNPTQLSQAIAGYATGSKDGNGNYDITIPSVQLGANGLIDLYLATNSGDTGWVAMNVNGSSQQTVATPTFSVAAGTYSSAQSVALSCGTSGATIHYTTDGSTPNASSAVYSSPINVSSSETINAYAVESGMTDSSVASAAYVINSGSIPAWAPNVAYNVGNLVTYNGSTYKCLQAHTSLVGWEPPAVPALWQLQ